jgi:ADP-ribose pyrophosphatase
MITVKNIKIAYECPRFKVIESLVEILKDDQRIIKKLWHVENNPWTRIVPIDNTGKVTLIKERRLLTDDLVWRLPGGRVDIGEQPKEAAIREMIEEIKMEAATVELLFTEKPTASWYKQTGYVYVAFDIKPSMRLSTGDIDEYIELYPTSFESAINMADEGLFDAWMEKSIRHSFNWYKNMNDKK